MAAFSLGFCLAAGSAAQLPGELHQHVGMCDASAALALDALHFAVANDEDNQIRIYRNDRDGPPVAATDLSAFLQVDRRHPETDLEGAARLGDHVYWITSHAANQDGEPRPSRHRLFATRCESRAGRFEITPVGRPFQNLVRELVLEPRFRSLRLAAGRGRAPKERGAINIEGLAATPDGKLLIGFRNPIPDGKAVLVPIENPEEVIQGRRPQFGDAIRLDLGGYGVRDIVRDERGYWIIAGSYDGKGDSRLYRWPGPGQLAEKVQIKLKDFNAEALIAYQTSAGAELQLISDDGNESVGGQRCKDLKNPVAKRFRSLRLDPL